jgi:hypothetical protein
MEGFEEHALWLLFRKYCGDDLLFFFLFCRREREGIGGYVKGRVDWMIQEPMNAAGENGRLSMAEEGATPACEFADWCKFTPYDSRE